MDTIDTNKPFREIGKEYPPIDTSKFLPLTAPELIAILGLTIKRDETNKLLTFLAQLSAYTEDSQLNISFNAPSSSGKSFIPLEVSTLFPQEDVLKLGSASATAFYHEQGVYDKEKNTITVDLSRKIIIFLDQPSTQLLSRLRALLSHDEKEIMAKITDKNQKGGNRTKTVIIRGFPAVIFCTAGLEIDEQEATRFLLLSPEINQEKIRQAIFEKIKKEANSTIYKKDLETNLERKLLKERIIAIKEESIVDIQISNPELIKQLFLERAKTFKPRHQRDIGRIISLVKVFALLNLWFRERHGLALIASNEDILEAFKIWDIISESQELNLPPYVYNLYKDVIVKAYKDKNGDLEGDIGKRGLSRQEILQKHYEIHGRFLPDWYLRQQIIPPLEAAGLIIQEADPNDKRKMLIYPTGQLTASSDTNNSELQGGVTDNLPLTQAEQYFVEMAENEENHEVDL